MSGLSSIRLYFRPYLSQSCMLVSVSFRCSARTLVTPQWNSFMPVRGRVETGEGRVMRVWVFPSQKIQRNVFAESFGQEWPWIFALKSHDTCVGPETISRISDLRQPCCVVVLQWRWSILSRTQAWGGDVEDGVLPMQQGATLHTADVIQGKGRNPCSLALFCHKS